MVSYTFLALVIQVASCVAPALALKKATIYSQEPCAGESAEIEVNGRCVPVPDMLMGNVTAVKVPKHTDCFLFKGENCDGPILHRVKYPGMCRLSEWDTSDQKVSNESKMILCYDSSKWYKGTLDV